MSLLSYLQQIQNTTNALRVRTSPAGENTDINQLVTQPFIATMRYNNNSDTIEAWTNENSATNTTSPYTGALNGFNIGSYNDGQQQFLDGSISEVIIFDKLLSNSEITKVREYLADKWSIDL